MDDYKNNFAVFILTHGRPDRIDTLKTLRESGYSGKIYLVIDDQDKTSQDYIELYGTDNVIIFNKSQYIKETDYMDNFSTFNVVVFARNAVFDIAENLNVEYFLVLDDDYKFFEYRFDTQQNWSKFKKIKNLDDVFSSILKFYISAESVTSIALAQGGDFIGGSESSFAQAVKLTRKCMNSFFCSTKRRFKFLGRINEDVNAYVLYAATGSVFFTTNLVSLTQRQTQSNAGGLTDAYLHHGTYVKSFYSVICNPSSVKVSSMGDKHKRIHHKIKWENTTPMIMRQQ